jgi:hypothetical protein
VTLVFDIADDQHALQDKPEIYASKAGSYYHIRVEHLLVTLGFLLPFIAEVFRNQSSWTLDDSARCENP